MSWFFMVRFSRLRRWQHSQPRRTWENENVAPETLPQRGSVCKGKVWIFEHMIHQDDPFPHDGGECDLRGFAGRDQPVVKRFEQVIAPTGRQRGHVEGAAQFGPTTTDAAFAGPLPAVAVIRAKAGQRGGLLSVE